MTVSADYVTLQRAVADELGDRLDIIAEDPPESGLSSSPVKRAIQSAIARWEREAFYFNEEYTQPLFTTVAGREIYTVADGAGIGSSPDIYILHALISANRYTLQRRDWSYLEQISPNADLRGQPAEWAWLGNQIRLYPIPDNAYPVRATRTARLAALAADADSNAWITEGYDLIKAEAKLILARDVLHDTNLMSECTMAIFGNPSVPRDTGYLGALKAETNAAGEVARPGDAVLMANPLRLPLAAWEPDLPDTPGQSAAVVRNVYPKTPASYGPVGSPAPLYDALAGRCLGAASYISSNNLVHLFAGSEGALYHLSHGTPSAWQDISNPDTPYSITRWRFAVFNGQVIAVDRNVVPQVVSLLTPLQYADLAGGPPTGRYIAVVKNAFVMLGDTHEPSDGSSWNDRLHWSAVGNHEDWPTPGTTEAAQKQSGTVRLFGPSGKITGIVAGLISADAIVFQEFGVQRLSYVGPPTTFQILPVEGVRGTRYPDSIVVYGGIAYYWSDDGIYAFDGQQSRPIGANKVDATVFADLNKSEAARVVGVADPKNKLILWSYPSEESSGDPDRLLIYSWVLDRFTICYVESEFLVPMLGVGYTLAELETVLGYETVAEIPYPLSSDVWIGGLRSLALFDLSHRLAYLHGPALEAIVDTPELQLTPGMRQLITGARPLIDGEGTAPAVSIGRRERLVDPVRWTAGAAMNRLGVCPMRASGRYVRARITVPAESDAWAAISGIELDPVPQGRR